MTTVRYAVIGLNGIGREHARLIARHPVARLSALVDTDPFVLEQNSREYGVPGLRDYRDLLQSNVYCTGPGGVWVLNSDGCHLGTLVVPELPANCAWGDHDWRGLYITARTSVYKIRVKVPGVPVP